MNEFGRRRSEIIRYLGALTDREKLLALAYLPMTSAAHSRPREHYDGHASCPLSNTEERRS